MDQPLETFVVAPEEHRLRLDVILAARYPGVSRTRLRRAIGEADVLVGGVTRTAGMRINAGELISVRLDIAESTALTPEALPLTILFEDEHLIVVDKPAGMVVHPAGRHRSGTLMNALAHHFNVLHAADPPVRPGMVHRLDRSTSGLMVIAKTQAALSRLTVAFQRKQVEKRYLALVNGRVEMDEGIWEAPIGNDPTVRPAWGIREGGRRAETRYSVRARPPNHTLLELEPVTGRTNQLRLHCAHFGHPIVGDDLFGLNETAPLCPRLFLHAWRIAFPHPERTETLTFESSLPSELAVCLVSVSKPTTSGECDAGAGARQAILAATSAARMEAGTRKE